MPAWGRLVVRDPVVDRIAGQVARDVALLCPLFADLKRELVPRHRGQQLEEVFGGVDCVLPGRGAKEEAAEDGLTDVHRVEEGREAAAAQPDADDAANGWLVPPDQVGRSVRVAGADALDQVGE